MVEQNSSETITRAVNSLRSRIEYPLQMAVILGSGLGEVSGLLTDPIEVSYSDIPGYPRSTVAGHAGKAVAGFIGKTSVLFLMGRSHYYEGYSLSQVTFGVRLLGALGIRFLMVTNAAGGIRDDLNAGDVMLISDHINFMGNNPLIGPHDESYGKRFVDLTNAYDLDLRSAAQKAAGVEGFPLSEGVYAAMSGPSYETPAEIRMLSRLGADAVGMSTVPEVIVARQMEMRVLGLSLISNKAAGLQNSLNHNEVMEAARSAGKKVKAIVSGMAEYVDSI